MKINPRSRPGAIATATAAVGIAALALAPTAQATDSSNLLERVEEFVLATESTTRCNATECTHDFAYLRGPITFTVPEGVTTITADIAGGRGGSAYGGKGGALRTELTVTPGEKLTAYNPEWGTDWLPNFLNVPYGGGGSALYRGEGADAELLAVAGGGGAGGYPYHRGGDGGGYHALTSRQLIGGDGAGWGGGTGASPSGPGWSPERGHTRKHAPSGQVGAPGTFGMGGTNDSAPVLEWIGGEPTPRDIAGGFGGSGYFGGGSGIIFDRPNSGLSGSDASGGGGGAGYIAEGLPLLKPSDLATTLASVSPGGGITLTWAATGGATSGSASGGTSTPTPTVSPTSAPVDDETPTDEEGEVEPPTDEEGTPQDVVGPEDPEDGLIEGDTLSGEAEGTTSDATSGSGSGGLLASTGAQVTGLTLLALALVGGGILLRRAGVLTGGRTRHAR